MSFTPFHPLENLHHGQFPDETPPSLPTIYSLCWTKRLPKVLMLRAQHRWHRQGFPLNCTALCHQSWQSCCTSLSSPEVSWQRLRQLLLLKLSPSFSFSASRFLYFLKLLSPHLTRVQQKQTPYAHDWGATRALIPVCLCCALLCGWEYGQKWVGCHLHQMDPLVLTPPRALGKPPTSL